MARPDAENPDTPESEVGDDLLLPGGKVDADAVRRVIGGGADADDEGLARVTFKLQRDLDKRLDKYLTDRITFMSRSQLQRLIDEGGVTVNGRRPKASTKLRIGDEVEVVVPPPPVTEIQPENIPLEVMFEDDHLIVINKSPDIIVHPARSHNKGTLVHALAWHFRYNSASGGGLSTVGKEFARPGVVHRLDRHTSGVMVAAKTDEAHWKLGRQFELRQTDKRYLAVVEGVIEADADVIEQPIGPSPSKAKGQREKMVVRHDELGRAALTIYRVRQRFGGDALGGSAPGGAALRAACGEEATAGTRRVPPHLRAELLGDAGAGGARLGEPRHRERGFTVVELELKTGRTHQIRVHLSHMGFPIVGDDLYGGHHSSAGMLDPALRRGVGGDEMVIARQALHAAMLTFVHPITEQKMTFQAPLRSDMAELVRVLRGRGDAGEVLTPAGAVLGV